MSDRSQIAWCDATWNPTRGCSPVSTGCAHCYAARMASRFVGPGQPYAGLARDGQWTGEVRLMPEALGLPLRWRKPRRILVDSMSDLFHERLSNSDIAAVFGVMSLAPLAPHTFIVLTKDAKRMRKWFEWIARTGDPGTTCNLIARFRCQPRSLAWSSLVDTIPWPLPNVILGVSVEDQTTADERAPELLATPAVCRAVSYEPALGPVDFARWVFPRIEERRLVFPDGSATRGLCGITGPGLDWIIVGGESGSCARPCDVAWIRATTRACREARVPCFVKALGARPCGDWTGRRPPMLRDHPSCRTDEWVLVDRKGGDPSEWSEDLRVREWPEMPR